MQAPPVHIVIFYNIYTQYVNLQKERAKLLFEVPLLFLLKQISAIRLATCLTRLNYNWFVLPRNVSVMSRMLTGLAI